MRLRGLWLVGGWLLCAAIIWLSLTPSPPSIAIEHGDKLGHLLAYGSLMFWFCQLYAERGARLACAIGFAAMGVALEFVQGALGYRTFEVGDMLANALGVLVGWAAVQVTGSSLFSRLEKELSARLHG